jgi:uncharacterized SAM-binding protein YcdF (DUF218 family)
MRAMNSLVSDMGLATWKPLLTALLLPPVPLLLLLVCAALLLWARRALGWVLLLPAVVGLWLSACAGVGEALTAMMLKPPMALEPLKIQALQRQVQTRRNVAIVVLGGGREAYAPEYRAGNLSRPSLERLRYGVWLARETGAPIAFSGGVGWAQTGSQTEAQIAARIAASEFGRPLAWTETESRDTRENAGRTIALLLGSNIAELVLVTHGWHMPRALRAFNEASAGRLTITAAPMGLARRVDRASLAWVPTTEGFEQVRATLRERVALALGN